MTAKGSCVSFFGVLPTGTQSGAPSYCDARSLLHPVVEAMLRTIRTPSFVDSSSGSKSYLAVGFALLFAAGCSASSGTGPDQSGLSPGGAAGAQTTLPGTGGVTSVTPPNTGTGGSTMAQMTTSPYAGQCPSTILQQCKA